MSRVSRQQECVVKVLAEYLAVGYQLLILGSVKQQREKELAKDTGGLELRVFLVTFFAASSPLPPPPPCPTVNPKPQTPAA